MLVARAVAELVRPVKMNYEVHGNTLPHLHLHLFPRHLGDPYVGGPIDPRASVVERSDDDIDALANRDLRRCWRTRRGPGTCTGGGGISGEAT